MTGFGARNFISHVISCNSSAFSYSTCFLLSGTIGTIDNFEFYATDRKSLSATFKTVKTSGIYIERQTDNIGHNNIFIFKSFYCTIKGFLLHIKVYLLKHNCIRIQNFFSLLTFKIR